LLNTGIAPCTADPADDQVGACRSIGVFFNGTDAAPDLQAWPNGRRLADDTVDMALRAVADGYGPILNSPLHLPNTTPNNIVGDGVDANNQPLLTTFPYIATPDQGYSHAHHGPGVLPLQALPHHGRPGNLTVAGPSSFTSARLTSSLSRLTSGIGHRFAWPARGALDSLRGAQPPDARLPRIALGKRS
jgi:hypothetical protein